MDPDIAFYDLCQALACCDREQAHDLADDLMTWIDRGGFPPQALASTRRRTAAETADRSSR